MLPPPAAAPPCLPSVPFYSEPPAVAVSCRLASPAPIIVTAYSLRLGLLCILSLHSALPSALSSVLLPPAWYFPPAQVVFLDSGESSDHLRHPAAVIVVPVTSVIPCPSPLPCLMSFPVRPCFFCLPPYPPLPRRLVVSCIRLRRSSHLNYRGGPGR